MSTQQLQIGDIVRVRETLVLVPLDKRTPYEIPAGIYGQIIEIRDGLLGETLCRVEFHEPYGYAVMTAFDAAMLDLVFRIPEF